MPKQSKNNKSARSANPCKSFCYFWLSPKVESPYPTDSNLQSKVALIRFCIIDFIYCLKLLGLDTSLRINATLSMTNRPHAVILNESNRHLVILMALARSIHFSDLQSKAIRGLCANLKAIRHRFTTPHTTFKGIQMQT